MTQLDLLIFILTGRFDTHGVMYRYYNNRDLTYLDIHELLDRTSGKALWSSNLLGFYK